MQHTEIKSRTNWLLAGAIIGAGLAATGLVEDRLSPVTHKIIATIDGEVISLAHYNSVVATVEKDRGKPLADSDKNYLLERMIDEKLLLQHAQNSGLTRSDSAVKKAIVDAVIENIISKNRGVIPNNKDLETFYATNLSYFSHTPVMRVQRMVFKGAEPHKQAQQAHSALGRGESFASIKQHLASEDVLQLPSSPIPRNRLPNYLGPTLAQALWDLEPGQFTAPLASGSSLVILGLIDKQSGQTPPLEKIRDQVTREFQRRQNDQALQDYLEDLKASANIRINRPLLLQLETTLVRE